MTGQPEVKKFLETTNADGVASWDITRAGKLHSFVLSTTRGTIRASSFRAFVRAVRRKFPEKRT